MRRTTVTAPRSPMLPFHWLSAPIALLAAFASAAGLLSDMPYAQETAPWAAQAAAQDTVNLVVYPALLVLAVLAARGSLRAHFAWVGVLAYSAYSYLLYAGYVHFSPLFLVYVAVLGLSVYALIGGLALLDPARVREAFDRQAPVRLVARLLVVFGVVFYALWLSEVVTAMLAGEAPRAAVENGLPVNVVHVLDMALLLPAVITAGVLLGRRRGLGYCLAAPLLTTLGVLTLAIAAMVASLAANGMPVAWGVVGAMGASGVLSFVALARLLTAVRPDASLLAVLRASPEATEGDGEPGTAGPVHARRVVTAASRRR